MTEPYRSTQQAIQSWRNAPIVDEVIPLPPPPQEASTHTTTVNDSNASFYLTAANVLITSIIITGMIVDGEQARVAIISGAAYFATTTVLYMLVSTGTIPNIVSIRAREKTERHRIDAYLALGEQAIAWRQAVEQNRHIELTQQAAPTDLQRRLAKLETDALERDAAQTLSRGSTYVTPYDNRSKAAHAAEVEPQVDTTPQEAVAWLSGLYNELGQVDRSKVQPDGRLKVRMLGSSRGPGSRDAGLWLIDKGVVGRVAGGFALNINHYPTRESLRNLI